MHQPHQIFRLLTRVGTMEEQMESVLESVVRGYHVPDNLGHCGW